MKPLTTLACLLTVLSLAQSAHSQGVILRPSIGGDSRGRVFDLLRNPAVHRELKLSDETAAKVKAIAADIHKKHVAGYNQAVRQRDDADKRRQRFVDWAAAASKEVHAALAELLDADQLARLRQLELQDLGTLALLDADVQKALKLSDDQQTAIATIVQQAGERMDKVYATVRQIDDFRTIAPELNRLRGEALEKIAEHFDETQTAAWKSHLGEPFAPSPPMESNESP